MKTKNCNILHRLLVSLIVLLVAGQAAHASTVYYLFHLVDDLGQPVAGATFTQFALKNISTGSTISYSVATPTDLGDGDYSVAYDADVNGEGILKLAPTKAGSSFTADNTYVRVLLTKDSSSTFRLVAGLVPVTGALTGTPTATTLPCSALSSTYDLYSGMEGTFGSGVLIGKTFHILSYNTSTQVMTLLAALPTTPSAGDTFTLSPFSKGLATMLSNLGTDGRPKISADAHTTGANVASVNGQAPPTNWSMMSIDSSGRSSANVVQIAGQTASAASAVTFTSSPTNFSLLSIDSSGKVALSSSEHTAIAGDVLNATASSYNTSGTIGNKINTGGSGGGGGGTVTGYATGQDPATLVLDAIASSHNTSGTIGNKINTAASGGGGGGGTVYVRTLLRVGTFPQSTPINPVRLTVGDTGVDIAIPLIDGSGVAQTFPDATTVTFTMKLKYAGGSPAINAASATLTTPDQNGVRYAQFSFSGGTPVPAAGDYTAIFTIAGTSYPIGRQIPVTTVSQP